ncbi:MAG: fimbrillin family protein [Prevotella sp.]|nr:fimbrillin family protein [Prevotella sp.]
MMKVALTKILLGLFALSALAGCSSEDGGAGADVPAPIAFGATEVSLGSRASTAYYSTAETGIPLAQSMGVFGYQYPATEDWAASDTANFMYNRRMVSKGKNDYGHTEFYYSPLSFWPQADTYRLAFFAYYPYSSSSSDTGIVPTVKPGTGMGSFAFTTKDKSSEQVDFMMSDLRSNLVYAASSAAVSGSDTVSFALHHMLSQVAFHVDTKTVPLGYTSFHVKSITMRRVAKRGTLRPAYTSADGTSFAWAVEPATDNDSVTVDGVVNDATEAVPCRLLLLPQDNSAISLRVEVAAVPVGGEQAIVGNATMLMSGTGVSGVWQRGRAYYYTLRLKELTKENKLYIYITPGAPDDPDQDEDYTGGTAIQWGGTWNGGDIDAAKPAIFSPPSCH